MTDSEKTPKTTRPDRRWALLLMLLVLLMAGEAALIRKTQPLDSTVNDIVEIHRIRSQYPQWSKYGLSRQVQDVVDRLTPSSTPSFPLEALAKTDPRWRKISQNRVPDVYHVTQKMIDSNPEPMRKYFAAAVTDRIYSRQPEKRQQFLLGAMKQDPQNAIYPICLANLAFTAAGVPDSSKVQLTSLKSAVQFQTALGYAAEAMRLKEINTYSSKVLWPYQKGIEPVTLSEEVVAQSELQTFTYGPVTTDKWFCRQYAHAMRYLARTGQREQAKRMMAAWPETLLHRLETTQSYLGNTGLTSSTSVLMRANAETAALLGDREGAAKYNNLAKKIRKVFKDRDGFNVDHTLRYGGYTAHVVTMLYAYNPLPAARYEPIRSAEQSFLERYMVVKTSLLLGVVLGLALIVMLIATKLSNGGGKTELYAFSWKETLWSLCYAMIPWVLYGLYAAFWPRAQSVAVMGGQIVWGVGLSALFSFVLPVFVLKQRRQVSLKALFALPDVPVAWFLLWIIQIGLIYPMFVHKEQSAWARENFVISRDGTPSPAEQLSVRINNRPIVELLREIATKPAK